MKRVRLAFIFALFLPSWARVAIAQDPMKLKFGTWELNLQKSKFPSGNAPRSDTRIYEDRGGGVIMSTHATVGKDGKEALTIYAAKFDGKQYPVATRGSGALSTSAFHMIDGYSESFVLTRDGKVVTRGTTSISKDGKAMTMTLDTTNAQGKPEQTIDIYEKQ
jgi:hypothetical protein